MEWPSELILLSSQSKSLILFVFNLFVNKNAEVHLFFFSRAVKDATMGSCSLLQDLEEVARLDHFLIQALQW